MRKMLDDSFAEISRKTFDKSKLLPSLDLEFRNGYSPNNLKVVNMEVTI